MDALEFRRQAPPVWIELSKVQSTAIEYWAFQISWLVSHNQLMLTKLTGRLTHAVKRLKLERECLLDESGKRIKAASPAEDSQLQCSRRDDRFSDSFPVAGESESRE